MDLPQPVLIVATTLWPLSARLALRFIQYGCPVSALCPVSHPLEHIHGLSARFSFSSLDPVRSLDAVLARTHPALVVPCDDRAALLCHALAARFPAWRRLIQDSLGDPASYPVLTSRFELTRCASSLGLLVPHTARVRTAQDLRDWFSGSPGSSVMKLDLSWGGNGVEFVDSLEPAKRVFDRMARPMSVWLAVKRRFIDDDRLAYQDWRHSYRASISIQSAIKGTAANCMIAAHDGKLLGIVAVDVLESQGPKGAALVVRLTDHEDITAAACALTQKLGLSGFHGLDFIVEEKTRRAYLIELNPRCTQLGHLMMVGAGDLAGILCERVFHHSIPNKSAGLALGSAVAFFPQALKWGSRMIEAGYHDVPWDEPELVAELLRTPGFERRLRYRAYHSLRNRWSRDDRKPVPPAQLTQATPR